MSKLNIQIEHLLSNNASDFEISKIFKNDYKEYLNNLNEITKTNLGKDFFVKHTKYTDNVLILIYKYILRKNFGSHQPMSTSIPITLIALGSYGREELCIYSDIDILILYEDIKGYNIKSIIEEFIAFVWDCGLKIGSRVDELKNIENVAKEDITIKSSIIESRIIYGSKVLWVNFQNSLRRVFKTEQKRFILEKFEEHNKRLLHFPLTMEPNIKDGYGGIREANMLYWISKTLFGLSSLKDLVGISFNEDEYKKYRQALEFIFQTRTSLHSIAKKKKDQITFDILPELSKSLNFKNNSRYTKERLCMAKIISCLHIIHNFTKIMLKKITRSILFEKSNISHLKQYRHKKNIYIINNKVFCSFHSKPVSLNNLIKEISEFPITIDSFDSSYIYYASKAKIPKSQSKSIKKSIKNILSKPKFYHLIKLIYDAELLTKIISSTKMFINQPQFDGYHKHPVDVHSIKTLEFTNSIKDEYVKSIFETLSNEQKILVRLVAFFHDIGKGTKDDHHIVGEKLFKKTLKHLDFEEDFIKIGSNLVRYHNMLSYLATHEDIYSENTIIKLIGILKNKDSLKMLYIVTYCDISAVGENIYSSFTASLLKQLYNQTLLAFNNNELIKESTRRIAKQNSIAKLEKYKQLTPGMQKKVMNISSNQIFLKMKAEEILNVAIKAKNVVSYIYKIINESQLTIKIIRAWPLNLGYLLGKLEFLNIDSMNIYKLYDDKKVFEISFSENVNENDLSFIENIIKDSFDMNKRTKSIIPNIKKEDIKINNNHTANLASMKIVTKDQKGLFAYIAKIFDDFNIEIESAKLYTLKGIARDLLLIEKNKNFIEKQNEILNLICNTKK